MSSDVGVRLSSTGEQSSSKNSARSGKGEAVSKGVAIAAVRGVGLKSARIALIGAGQLGEAILAGLLGAGILSKDQVVATAAHESRTDYLAERFNIRVSVSNREAVRDANLILLSVKPRVVKQVLEEIRDDLHEGQVLISTVASVPTRYIENLVGKSIPVVRTMPNTPCLIRMGMTALCAGAYAEPQHLELGQQVFDCLGRTIIVDERHMDAVTGLSASGPAYIYIVIESLAEGGVKMGLPRDIATQLAAQTVLGAGSMVLQSGEHPARLKDTVTTPAGCTIDGILELEEGGLRVTLIKAVVRATQRAKELLHT
jgi:pyrroline-5-carboxylate reductase